MGWIWVRCGWVNFNENSVPIRNTCVQPYNFVHNLYWKATHNPFIINFNSVLKIKTLKYTFVNNIRTAFSNIRKAIKLM